MLDGSLNVGCDLVYAAARRFPVLGGGARPGRPPAAARRCHRWEIQLCLRMQLRYLLLDGAESGFEKPSQCRIVTSTEETPEAIFYTKSTLVSEDVNFGGRIHGSERESLFFLTVVNSVYGLSARLFPQPLSIVGDLCWGSQPLRSARPPNSIPLIGPSRP